MSEFNFDKMQNLNIPDEWAEKTIATVSGLKDTSKKNIPYSRYVFSFASVVFVVVLSIVVFMSTQNNGFFPTAQLKDEAAVAVSQTEISTTKQSSVETSSPTEPQTEIPTEEIDTGENCTEYVEENYPDDYVDPDMSGGSSNSSSSNDSNPGASMKPGSSSNNLKPNTPSNPAGKPNDSGGNSNSNPSSKPSSSDSIKYLIAPDYDTEKPAEEKCLYTSFIPYPYVGPAKGDETFYCKIVTRKVELLLGDPDLYSDERIAEVYSTDGDIVSVRFCAGKNGGVTKNGDYDFYVYNADGVIQSIDRVRITWFDE